MSQGSTDTVTDTATDTATGTDTNTNNRISKTKPPITGQIALEVKVDCLQIGVKKRQLLGDTKMANYSPQTISGWVSAPWTR